MSSTTSLDEAEYRSCGSQPDSPGGGVDTTLQGGNTVVNHGSNSPLPNDSSPLADHAALGSNDARETSFFRQLTTWLTPGGFRIDSKLPAVFQEDTKAPHHGSTDLSNIEIITIEKALVKRALARHDDAYVCGLRRDIFINLLDHARNMLGRHHVSNQTRSDPAPTDGKPALQTYTIEDDDILCIVAHVVRVMEALHNATMLASSSRDERVEQVGLKPNNLDPTAILPKSLKTNPNTGMSAAFSKSQITSATSARSKPTPRQPPGMHPGEAFQGNTQSSESAVRADGSDRRQQDEVVSIGVSTSRSMTPARYSENQHPRSLFQKTEAQAETPSCHAPLGFEPDITSFPALRKRHGTSDWLIPPATAHSSKESVSHNDLYSVGIDAHQGGSTSHSTLASIQTPWPTLHVEVGKLAFRTPSYVPQAGEQVVAAPVGEVGGATSGERLSSHTRMQVHQSLPEPPSRHSSIVQRLGIGSPAVSKNGPGRQRQNTLQTDIVRRSSSVEMMKAILETQKVDTSKRRDTIAVSRPQVAGGRSRLGSVETCSEDGRPHLCTDDPPMSSDPVDGQCL